VPISIPLALGAKRASWTIALEYGASRSGSVDIETLAIQERGALDQREFARVQLELPADLPLGYHALEVTLDTGLAGEARLIVAPERAFEPEAIQRGERVWGIAVQLYSLRSSRNWGMGDFRDLRELVELAAPLGCGIVGVNPLHALMPADPTQISPYSPSSRLFLNVLYICVEEVADFAECRPAQHRVAEPHFQALLRELRATRHVDYVRVAGAKFE